MKPSPFLLALLPCLMLFAAACRDADAPAAAEGDAVAPPAKVEAIAAQADDPAPPEAATPAERTEEPVEAVVPPPVPGDPAAAGGSEGDGSDGDAAPDPVTVLLETVRNKKTKDDAALAALEEAKTLGADPKDLATSANARGEKLGGDVERATVFFEWAAAADPKYPNATFNLAKISANAGDLDRAKELLIDVRARGGKRLLKNVGFDPTFALLADDPEVLALAK